ncbi:MAG: hypothetical protein ACRDZO_12060 [Egibacteraceae bacterium]
MGLVVGIVVSLVGAVLLAAGLFLLMQIIRVNFPGGAGSSGQIGIGLFSIQASDKIILTIILIILGVMLFPAFWYAPLVFSHFERVGQVERRAIGPVVPPSLPTPQVVDCEDNLLSGSWHLEAAGVAAEEWMDFDPPYKPEENDWLEITYDLHGLMAREGVARNDSVIVLTQPNWYGVSLATLSTNENGFDGKQTVYISVTEFHELPNSYEGIEGGRPLTWGKDVGSIRARFWDFDHFKIDITSIRICHE